MKNSKLALWTALICFVPLSFLLNDLISARQLNSAALAMRIETARLLNSGAQLFVDVYDWTSLPLISLIKADLQVASFLIGLVDGLRSIAGELFAPLLSFLLPDLFVPLSIFLLLIVSLAATCRLTLLSAESRPLLPLCFALALASFIVRFDFGDLQYLLVLALTPWLVLRARSWQGLSSPLYLRVVTGLLCGLSACLDPLYIAVYLLIELAFAIEHKSVKGLRSAECVGLAFVPVCYLLYLFTLDAPRREMFVDLGLALRVLQFGFADAAVFSPQSTPARFDVFYVALANLLILLLAPVKNTIARPLGVTLLAGLLIYVMQNDGRSFDLVLSIFASTALISLLLVDWLRLALSTRKNSGLDFVPPMFLLVSLALTIVVSQMLGADCERLGKVRRQSDPGQNELGETIALRARARPIALLADSGAPFYPAVLIGDCQPVLCLSELKPLMLLQPLKEQNALTPVESRFYQECVASLRNKLEEKAASVLLVSQASEALLGKLGLTAIIESNYRKDGLTHFYSSDNLEPHEYRGYNWPYAIYVEVNK